MNLEVKAGSMEWSIPIERRITILRGFSGEGKSDMVYNIANRSQIVKVDFPLECKVATETTWKDLLKSSTNSLIIFDDLEEVSSNEFAKLIKEYKDNYNYYLLITREFVGLDVESELSIAVSSILRFKVDETGLKHYTEKYSEF